MTKENVTVSFLPIHANDGTVYRCNVSISERVVEAFKDALSCEIAMTRTEDEDYLMKTWLSVPLRKQGRVLFLNLTQAEFFKKWLSRLSDIQVNKKRLMYNANTSLIVKL